MEAAVSFVRTALQAALHCNFFTCDEMSATFRELLEALNARPIKAYGKNRDDLFAKEQALLKALPAQRYEWVARHRRKAELGYRVSYDKRHYSDCRTDHRQRNRRSPGEHRLLHPVHWTPHSGTRSPSSDRGHCGLGHRQGGTDG